jgi:Uma2 family endonuclease
VRKSKTIWPVRGDQPPDPLGEDLRARLASDDGLYPYSDGKPLGESEAHMQCVRWLLDAIEDVLQGRENVSFHGDMFWYWQKGRPDLNRAPDVMVLFGVPMDPIRLSYKGWEHGGVVPAVIIETASAEQEDMLLGELRDDYERLGVKEYFVFDWSERYLDQQLYGFRLRGRTYQNIRPGADGCLLSRQLNVKMRPEKRMLRFVNAQTDEPIPTRSERLAAQQRELEARDAELAARETELAARETELTRKDAELKRARDQLRKAGLDPDVGK